MSKDYAPGDLPVPQCWIEGIGLISEDELPDRIGRTGDRYILAGREPVQCDDLRAWALWLAAANRLVRADTEGEVRVSTVFTGIDYSPGHAGPPLVFETIVLGGPDPTSTIERYATWAEAEAGHLRIFRTLLAGCQR